MTALPLGPRVHEALWAALIGQPEVGVALCDAEGLLVGLNPALEAMLGAPYQRTKPEEWSGVYHLFDEHDRPLTHENSPLLQALRGETVVDRVLSVRRGEGSGRYLRCHGARLHDHRGNSAGALVFAADVTAAVVQREELASLREQLVEVVNHELRTPVAVIKGHVELLDDLHEALPETATRHLEPIVRAVERLDGVLHSIRELADRSAEPTA
jgi:PAS domain S-box-containing protein